MKITFENLYGQGGKWYRVFVDGVAVGEIMQVMHSLNRISGWTWKHNGDKPSKIRKTYPDHKSATKALVQFNAKA